MDAVNQQALKDLKKHRDDGCHMLVPCMDQIADVAAGFRLIVTQVFLRPHPKDKDVYPHEGGHYSMWKNEWEKETGTGRFLKQIVPDDEMVRISGQGLEKLAQHTAIVWDRPTVRIDKEHKGRQLCELSGAVRMPDGFSFYRLSDAYGMDLDIVREQLEAQYIKADTKPEELPKKRANIDRDLLQKKVNQTKLCISGARNRIIRKILGVDGTYTVASLAKPFIAVRVIPWLDMNDAYTRRLVTEMNVKQMAITSLFGGQMPEQQQIAHDDQAAITYETSIPAEACGGDDDPNTIDAETTNGKTYTIKKDVDPDPSTSRRTDFLNSDPAGQAKTLVTMMSRGDCPEITKWLAARKAKPDRAEEAFLTLSAQGDMVKMYDYIAKIHPETTAEAAPFGM